LVIDLPVATDRISDVFFSADSKEIIMIGDKDIFHFAVLK
jgi:hypothetical protein